MFYNNFVISKIHYSGQLKVVVYQHFFINKKGTLVLRKLMPILIERAYNVVFMGSFIFIENSAVPVYL